MEVCLRHLEAKGTIRIVDDQNGYYYGYAYDAIISNGHDITYDYVSRFYYPTKGNVGLIYLNESHRIAIVKKVADDLYQSVEYLDNDFDYSEAQTEFKNLVLNDEEGYIEFDLYLTYAYPGSRFAAHKKHYFKVPK